MCILFYMSDEFGQIELIRIELNEASAMVLGALISIAMNEVLGLGRDLSVPLEALRSDSNLRFAVALENKLGDFCKTKTEDTVEVRCEDGKVSIIKELP